MEKYPALACDTSFFDPVPHENIYIGGVSND